MDGTEIPEGLNEWEQIQSPISHTSSTTQSREWELIVIRSNPLHDDFSVFPPSHHEGLQTTPQEAPSHEEPNSSASSSLSEERPQVESESESAGEIRRRLRLHFDLLSSRVFRLASTVRSRVGFWSIPSVTGILAALLISVLYLRVQRWRRRFVEDNKNRLFLLIKEKDEKISHLLLQIAQMNELLSTRRSVPVLRIN